MYFTRRGWMLAAAGLVATSAVAQPKLAKIRFGFSLYGMKTLPLKEAILACAKIGYDGVELALMPGFPAEPKLLKAADRQEIRKLLSDHRLDLQGLMLNINEPADAAQRRSADRDDPRWQTY
jgi:sugar phosphate isomerase/epimerase